MKKLSAVFLAFILCAAILISCNEDARDTGSRTSAAGTANDTPSQETSEESAPSVESSAPENSLADTSNELIKTIFDINDFEKLGLEKNSGEEQFIRAFLSKDTETLEQLCNLETGIYDELKTLEFGKYSISSFEGNSSGLVFKFTVLSSELDTLPPGEYSYYVGQGADTWEMTPARTQNHTEPQKTLEKWLMVSGDYLYRNYSSLSKDEQTRYRYYITYYLLWQYGDLTLEELQQYALELFSIKNFQPYESVTMLVDGKYRLMGHGAIVWRYSFVGERKENEKTFVTIQYYADPSELIKSHKVECEMQEKDGEWAFIGSRVLEESPYEPYRFGL